MKPRGEPQESNRLGKLRSFVSRKRQSKSPRRVFMKRRTERKDPSAAVPEPTSLAVIKLAMAGGLLASRRR